MGEIKSLTPGKYRLLGASQFGGCFENSRLGFTAEYEEDSELVTIYRKDGIRDRAVTLKSFTMRFLFERIYGQ